MRRAGAGRVRPVRAHGGACRRAYVYRDAVGRGIAQVSLVRALWNAAVALRFTQAALHFDAWAPGGPAEMDPYRAMPDLLAVTRRIGALQLEQSVLLHTVHDEETRAHASEVERELNALENALDSIAKMLRHEPDEPDEPDESDGYESTTATPQLAPDVSRELETHMARVAQLAIKRDTLEEEIAAASLGESRKRSQRLLEDVEIELSELECTLDGLACQFGGEDGPLSWAISPRTRREENSLSFHDDAEGLPHRSGNTSRALSMAHTDERTSPSASPDASRRASADEHAGGELRAPDTSIFSSSDSDDGIATRATSAQNSLPVGTPRDPTPSAWRTAGYARRIGGDRKEAPAPYNDISRRAEARSLTRALLDGGLGHAMRGLRPSG
eukprot:COSAG02_NODE_48_length_45421_cov_103.222100_2_plen_387_part_00